MYIDAKEKGFMTSWPCTLFYSSIIKTKPINQTNKKAIAQHCNRCTANLHCTCSFILS